MESKALGDNVPRMSLWWEGWVGGWVEGDAGWAQDFFGAPLRQLLQKYTKQEALCY